MGTKTSGSAKPIEVMEAIPPSAAREYISDMLAELCVVAKQGGHEDLYVLLKLTTQAVRNATP